MLSLPQRASSRRIAQKNHPSVVSRLCILRVSRTWNEEICTCILGILTPSVSNNPPIRNQPQRWRDVTGKRRLIQAMEYSALQNHVYFVKLTLVKLLTFTNPTTLQAYRTQKNLFFEQEGGRDRYTSIQSFLEGKADCILFNFILLKALSATYKLLSQCHSGKLQA
jgi:hypothetical protein